MTYRTLALLLISQHPFFTTLTAQMLAEANTTSPEERSEVFAEIILAIAQKLSILHAHWQEHPCCDAPDDPARMVVVAVYTHPEGQWHKTESVLVGGLSDIVAKHDWATARMGTFDRLTIVPHEWHMDTRFIGHQNYNFTRENKGYYCRLRLKELLPPRIGGIRTSKMVNQTRGSHRPKAPVRDLYTRFGALAIDIEALPVGVLVDHPECVTQLGDPERTGVVGDLIYRWLRRNGKSPKKHLRSPYNKYTETDVWLLLHPEYVTALEQFINPRDFYLICRGKVHPDTIEDYIREKIEGSLLDEKTLWALRNTPKPPLLIDPASIPVNLPPPPLETEQLSFL